MEINWQDIFYITSSFSMIAFLIICIWLFWVLYNVTRLIVSLKITAHKWGDVVDDVKYFKEIVKMKVSKFILKIIDQVNHNKKGGEKV